MATRTTTAWWGRAHPSVPVYIGEATQRILLEATFFTGTGADLRSAGYLEDRVRLRLGPFSVTPFLIDHAPLTAYALLIEAGGRRLLYSDDLRAPGRKAALFQRLVRDPPRDVNVLLLEGTNIAGDTEPAPGPSERDVEVSCVDLVKATRGIVLACYSPQDVDRLVTLFRARHAERPCGPGRHGRGRDRPHSPCASFPTPVQGAARGTAATPARRPPPGAGPRQRRVALGRSTRPDAAVVRGRAAGCSPRRARSAAWGL